ncbi:hypothetical protein IB211_01847 [Intestinimonas butyriciproducens]|uniref:Uncharacterized protein n=1 Tax=Intestinimonas butyriciproducens TaxID=1297617 RepID=A0A0S2W4H8_9FIRM|nr:hypothetical protein IB211_01847 [Intestinimonas butyriciproducens]
MVLYLLCGYYITQSSVLVFFFLFISFFISGLYKLRFSMVILGA